MTCNVTYFVSFPTISLPGVRVLLLLEDASGASTKVTVSEHTVLECFAKSTKKAKVYEFSSSFTGQTAISYF